MIISLIAAVDTNFGIGLNNKLPWGKIKEDMLFFKETTLNHTVIMGRNTFESMGEKALPDRKNIVLTRNVLKSESESENLIFINSLETALTRELLIGSREIFIIGGERVYNESMKYADRLYITHIPDNFDCDTFFPSIDKKIYNSRKIKSIEYKGKDIDICLYKRYM